VIPGQSDWSEVRNFLVSIASYEGFAITDDENGDETAVYTYEFLEIGDNKIRQNYYLINGELVFLEITQGSFCKSGRPGPLRLA
jgi:hypothetical protein